MALAAMACVGSLLGWQFTLATTAKDAADANMFPKIFGKVTGAGAPISGMVIMGILQSVMALSTISPNLSEQFAALVNLAVVTNVVPYIISLSALFVMMRDAKVEPGVFRRNAFVAVVAMLYSVYALWASGKDAVMGGMLVMGIGYIVYGFIAPRFVAAPAVRPREQRHEAPQMHTWLGRPRRAAGGAVCVLALPAAAAGTLDKARSPAS